MAIKSNMLNGNRFLLMMLFTVALFNSLLANDEGKTFEVSKTHPSAKAITDKKELNVDVTFEPTDYSEEKSFGLTVGGCKLTVKASKKSETDISFDFYNGKGYLDTVANPKSFLVDEQKLIFKKANNDPVNFPPVCDDGFNFVPMDEDPNKFTIEIALEGGESIPEHLVLKSNNLAYVSREESKKFKLPLWAWIVIVAAVFLLLVIVAIVVGLCICKCQKKKAAKDKKSNDVAKVAVTAEKNKIPRTKGSKEVTKTAVSAEQNNVPSGKEVSEDQRPTKEQDSIKDNKSLKAKKDKKLSARSSAPQEKPATVEAQPKIEAKHDAQEPETKTAIEKPDDQGLQEVTAEYQFQPPKRTRPLNTKEKISIAQAKYLPGNPLYGLKSAEESELRINRDRILEEGDRRYELEQAAKAKAAKEKLKKQEDKTH